MKKVKLDKEVINLVLPNTNPTSFTSPKTTPMLPPESWEQIFSEFHSTDFLSVINSTPEWNHLLSSRKTVELFESVLPFVMKFLPKDDFLKTRLISRAWKRGTDCVYDNHPSRLSSFMTDLKFPKLSSTGSMIPTTDTGIKFQTLESFQRFTTSMNLDTGNPFPGRRVRLLLKRERKDEEDYNSDEEDEDIDNDPIDSPEYWTALDSLLTHFGEHIWYLDLEYLFGNPYVSEVETRLQRILYLVPNLRKLSLTLGSEHGFREQEWTDFNDRFVQYFSENPPPKLGKLEAFSFESAEDECGHTSRAVHQFLKSYCEGGNLKKLQLDMPYETPILLPELLELDSSMDYKTLPHLKEASPKLEKLFTHFHYEHGVHHGPADNRNIYKRNDYDSDEESYESFDDEVEYHDCNISTIFDGLHLFGDTLKELDIDDNTISCNKRRENYTVELPRLERLSFKFNLPVRHLIELKSLKYLKIDGSPGLQDRAYGAELFEHLPKLGLIVHENDYRRRVVVRPKI